MNFLQKTVQLALNLRHLLGCGILNAPSLPYDHAQCTQRAQIRKRIPIAHDQVRRLSFLNRSGLITKSSQLRIEQCR